MAIPCPSIVDELSGHTGTLIALLGILLTISGGLIVAIYKVMMNIALTLKTDILEMIERVDGRVGEVWDEIGEIRKRQEKLREDLPKEYLRLEGPGYKVITEGIGRIETHLEKFIDDCRSGKCGAKKNGD